MVRELGDSQLKLNTLELVYASLCVGCKNLIKAFLTQ